MHVKREEPALRIWEFGKSSWASTVNAGDPGPEDEEWGMGCGLWADADGDVFAWDESEVLNDPIPDLIAANTSPFNSVPRGPEALSEAVSSPNSEISNLADGLILLKLVWGVLSLAPTPPWVDFSSLLSEPLDKVVGTFLISSRSSTLQINSWFQYTKCLY